MKKQSQRKFSSFKELQEYGKQTFDLQPKNDDSLLSKAIKAYDAKLFIPFWSNQDILSNIIRNYNEDPENFKFFHISLIEEEHTQKPIALAIINLEKRYISTFVNPEYRGQNLGSKVIKKALQETNSTTDNIYALEGEQGSHSFYAKNDMVTFPEMFTKFLFKIHKLTFLNHHQELINQFIEYKIKEAKEKFGSKPSISSQFSAKNTPFEKYLEKNTLEDIPNNESINTENFIDSSKTHYNKKITSIVKSVIKEKNLTQKLNQSKKQISPK